MCDLRPASEAENGVPDRVVDSIVDRLVRLPRARPGHRIAS